MTDRSTPPVADGVPTTEAGVELIFYLHGALIAHPVDRAEAILADVRGYIARIECKADASALFGTGKPCSCGSLSGIHHRDCATVAITRRTTSHHPSPSSPGTEPRDTASKPKCRDCHSPIDAPDKLCSAKNWTLWCVPVGPSASGGEPTTADEVERMIVPHGPNGECSDPDLCTALTDFRLAVEAEARASSPPPLTAVRAWVGAHANRIDHFPYDGQGGQTFVDADELDAFLTRLSDPDTRTGEGR